MCTEGFLHVYRLIEGATKFQLLHKTSVNDITGALCEYNGRLLVGVGPILRIYELGKRKLLRKCESKKLPNHIVSIWNSEDKIIVGDIQHSYHFVKYNRADNILYIFADDCIPRWLTSGFLLDPTTIAAGDKFGNIFVTRLPDKVNQQLEEDPTGGTIQWNTKDIAGAPYKLDMLINFYVGETVAKVIKTNITPGASDVILYATTFGTIGVFLPFSSREDIDFFTNLEMHMRTEFKPICGREHLSFRSYYAPCRNVVDGDLCEQFPNITSDQQRKIADDLERTPGEVLKKLEELRNSI
jgi:splicing factor 3B subunit 3